MNSCMVPTHRTERVNLLLQSYRVLIQAPFLLILTTLAFSLFLFPLTHECSAKETSDPEEQFTLGVQYMQGQGVEKDDKKAIYWFREAADQHYAPAQYNLGVLYENGIGVRQSDKKAVSWYEKAVKQGHLAAMNNYAHFLWQKNGNRKNCTEALRLFRKAVDSKSLEAQDNLGSMYKDGACGLEQDNAEAVRNVMAASMAGNAVAQTRLGSWFAVGEFMPVNYEQALFWVTLGAQQGVEFAKNAAVRYRKNLSPQQALNVQQRVAAFTPVYQRPQSSTIVDLTYSLSPDPIPPGANFDLVFRYMYIDPIYADDTAIPVEFRYEIFDAQKRLLSSELHILSHLNGQTGQIIKKNMKATSRPGVYSLILHLKFKYGRTHTFKKVFTIE